MKFKGDIPFLFVEGINFNENCEYTTENKNEIAILKSYDRIKEVVDKKGAK